MAAVEDAFKRHALGRAPPPGILSMHCENGSVHVKAAFLEIERPYYAAKVNANFPQNAARHGLPTIQGVVVLCDAVNGTLRAVMDSMSITSLRTAAATAVAAKYLSRENCGKVLVCGSGGQASAQLRALLGVRTPAAIYAFDQDAARAASFADAFGRETSIAVTPVSKLGGTVAECGIVITCTTSKRNFITRDMVRPGTFVAAVGADNEEKQEIEPALLAMSKVVTDLTGQCATIGDLHHALDAGAMKREDVHAELGQVIAGLRPGRQSDTEVIVFDSSGTALQDAAAAAAVYRRALSAGVPGHFAFGE